MSRLSFWIGGSPIVFQLFLCYTTACFDDKTIGGEYEKEEINMIEEIIKYIFEDERKNLRKEKGF